MISLREIVRHKGTFYPTCSLIFRRKYYDNYPEFCLQCHVGDYPLLIYLATQNNIFYLSDIMSVYRNGHSGSWTNCYKSCDSQKKEQYHQSGITMLEQMNCFTDYRYNEVFQKKIMNVKINYALKNKRFEGLNFASYKGDLKEIDIVSRLRLLIKMYLTPVRIISWFKRNG